MSSGDSDCRLVGLYESRSPPLLKRSKARKSLCLLSVEDSLLLGGIGVGALYAGLAAGVGCSRFLALPRESDLALSDLSLELDLRWSRADATLSEDVGLPDLALLSLLMALP